MPGELLSRQQMLRDVANSPVVALCGEDEDGDLDVTVRLPYDCYIDASTLDYAERQVMSLDFLETNRLLRNTGIATRLCRALAYITLVNGIDTIVMNTKNPYVMQIIQSQAGQENVVFAESYRGDDVATLPSIAGSDVLDALRSRTLDFVVAEINIGQAALTELEKPILLPAGF